MCSSVLMQSDYTEQLSHIPLHGDQAVGANAIIRKAQNS